MDTDDEILKWKKQCLSKYKYVTFGFAEKAAMRMTKKYGKPTAVYQCPHCQSHHLTTRGYGKKR